MTRAHRRLLAALAASLVVACGPVHRYPDGTGIEGQLEREVVALQLRVRELQQQVDGGEGPATDDALLAELKQVFGATDVAVTPLMGQPCLVAPTDVIFADPYALRLRDEATMVFDLLATVLQLHPDQSIMITGHTSDRSVPSRRGRPQRDHLMLGAAQAHAFATHLSAHHDVAPRRVSIASKGARAPRSSNDLPEGQDDNERLDLCFRATPPESSPAPG